MNVNEFFKFSFLGSVTQCGVHHAQCIFIIYDPVGRERNNFQQLSQLIELKFTSTT